ncbi:ATP phosphoribosyltransferase [Myroides sp. LJL110]
MSKLRIAIQKSGRLSQNSMELLQECAIKIPNTGGKLIAQSSNFPLEVLFLRDDDILKYVQKGVADIGIIGQNVFYEQNSQLEIVESLGFSCCRVCLAVDKASNYSGLEYFQGRTIATSYPVILKSFLDKHNITACIETISGSVEIAPGIGLADGICDIVSSGSTLISNGLKPVETILQSQAILVANEKLSESKKILLDKLLFRIQGVLKSKENKYILLNAPDQSLEKIIEILPGIKSPSVLPLAQKGWSSVHSVIKEDTFWEIIDQLKQVGAQGILVLPIQKMIY